jgi:hypothetical protein
LVNSFIPHRRDQRRGDYRPDPLDLGELLAGLVVGKDALNQVVCASNSLVQGHEFFIHLPHYFPAQRPQLIRYIFHDHGQLLSHFGNPLGDDDPSLG